MTQAKQIEVGTVVAISTGCYSDYGVGPFGKVLKPINQEVWEAMAEAAFEPNYWGGRHDHSKAEAWLIAQGYIELIEYTELHLGDYGSIEPWASA